MPRPDPLFRPGLPLPPCAPPPPPSRPPGVPAPPADPPRRPRAVPPPRRRALLAPLAVEPRAALDLADFQELRRQGLFVDDGRNPPPSWWAR